MCFDGPARTATHEMWCITATTTTTSTVPLRSLACFYEPPRAVAHELCTIATTYIFFVCLSRYTSKTATPEYVRTMKFWQIASGV